MSLLVHKLNSARSSLHATGATLGQEHLRSLRSLVEKPDTNVTDKIVVLDFSNIKSATASYLKATIIWLIQCARLSATDGLNHNHTASAHQLVPLPIFPLVTGLTEEVRGELDDVLLAYRLPCLETLKHSDRKVIRAALHGPLDDALADTLGVLTKSQSATASSLQDKFRDRGISTTGWNNRLADLYLSRLALRRKIGRQWLYEPVAAEVENGRKS